MNRIVALILLLIINVAAFADGILSPEFKPYNTIKSIRLPNSAGQATTVFQDHDGIMWIGTGSSLVRYDGYGMQNFLTKEILTNGKVLEIIQFGNYHLLIGLNRRIVLFNTLKGKAETLPGPLEKIKSARTILLKGSKLWIGSDYSGLYVYDIDKRTLNHCKSNSRLTSTYEICQVGNKLFVAGLEGLFVADISKKQIVLRKFPQINTFVNSLLWDNRAGVLYIGTEGELYTYRPSTRVFRNIKELQGNVCKSMTLDRLGNLIVGTDAGLCIYHLATQKVKVLRQNNSNGVLDNDIIWGVTTDRDGNVWLATQNGFSVMSLAMGCQYYDLARTLGDETYNNFTTLLLDSHKRLWLGGENGMTVIETQTGKARTFSTANAQSHLRHNRIRCIYEDRDGYIWIASDASVARFNEKTGRFEYVLLIAENNEKGNWAYSLYEDIHERMWIATYSAGLFSIEKQKLVACLGGAYHDSVRPQWMEKLKGDNFINNFIIGEPDELWLKGNGFVIELDTRTEKKQTYFGNWKDGGLASYCDHALWLADQSGKVIKFDRKKGKFVKLSVTLPDSRVMASVSQGSNLWISCPSALVSFNTQTNNITYYGRPKYLFLSGLLLSDKSEMVWGGENLLAVISPKLPSNRQRAYITMVNIRGSEAYNLMPSTKSIISLKRGNETLIKLSTLNYSSSQDVTFYYQLGKNIHWQQVNPETNELDLVHLASGTYRLSISTSNPEVNPDAIITSYTIKVPYPWYATGWAFLSYSILLALLVVLIVLRQCRLVKRRMIAEDREHTLESLRQRNEYFARLTQQMKDQTEKLERKDSNESEKIKEVPIEKKHLNEIDEKFLKQIDGIIEKYIDDDSFGVFILADKAGMPQKQLYRRIKQITDTTPVAYIRNYRLKKAAKFLKEGQYTLTEVMYMVGFNSMSYFIKCFSTEYNMTPKQFMEQ